GLVGAVLFVQFVLRPFIRWWFTSYTFTDRRFIQRTGFIAKEGRTIPLNRISGVDFEVGIVDRLFGCGTLVVSDASEAGTVLLHDIPQVERVQMQIAEELHRLSYPGTNAADDGT
ncbi:MAG: PH domain-containing protein, partial [Nocardioides sp.]